MEGRNYVMPSKTKMQKYADDGLCAMEVSMLTGIGYQSVVKYTNSIGVKLAHKQRSRDPEERYRELIGRGYSKDEARRMADIYDKNSKGVRTYTPRLMRVVKRVNLKKKIQQFQKTIPAVIRPWKGSAFGDML